MIDGLGLSMNPNRDKTAPSRSPSPPQRGRGCRRRARGRFLRSKHELAQGILFLLALALGVAHPQAANLIWNTTSGVWDVGLTPNWTGEASLFMNGDNVTFTNTAGGTVTVAAGGVAPGSTTVSAASGTYTLNGGPIGGSGTLTKSGGGTLTLSGSNTYSGQTTVSAGVLTFNSIHPVGGGASALGAPTTIANGTINLAGTMTYTGGTASSDRVIHLTGSGIFYNSGSGPLTLSGGITGNGSTFTARGTANISETGIIATGSGIVRRTDQGTLYLSNPNNSFSGALGCLAGTISVSSVSDGGLPSAIGQGTSITFGQSGFNGFGTLQFTGANGGTCNRAITISSHSGTADGGIIENTVAGQTLTLSGKVSVAGVGPTPQLQLIGAGNGVMSGVISDAPGTSSLSLTKAGAGTWTLSGANSYSGATTVSAGTLDLRGAGSIASSSYLTVAAGALLDVSAAPFTVGAAQTLAGAGTVAGAVTVDGIADSRGGFWRGRHAQVQQPAGSGGREHDAHADWARGRGVDEHGSSGFRRADLWRHAGHCECGRHSFASGGQLPIIQRQQPQRGLCQHQLSARLHFLGKPGGGRQDRRRDGPGAARAFKASASAAGRSRLPGGTITSAGWCSPTR